ncbi:hypothetical protein FB567DRAFT_540694 [Paraphoma chrysanthemicola]|uniref:Uncharacterized protein n=1 Tax=Paraphoma chrysanthemicola TaxID=798071 RepID=A0A8K0VRL4_9PLEO|nr:hypothetical protein FB567DRAFT_540694 [Paraphoma chrysanthemicola]
MSLTPSRRVVVAILLTRLWSHSRLLPHGRTPFTTTLAYTNSTLHLTWVSRLFSTMFLITFRYALLIIPGDPGSTSVALAQGGVTMKRIHHVTRILSS